MLSSATILSMINGYVFSKSFFGAIIPCVISAGVITYYRKKYSRLNKFPLLAGIIISIILSSMVSFWSSAGYHIIPFVSVFILQYALTHKKDFTGAMVYPLVFFPLLINDIIGAGWSYQWASWCWEGIGGAGLTDGLFLQPLAAVLLTYFLFWMRSRKEHLVVSGNMQGV